MATLKVFCVLWVFIILGNKDKIFNFYTFFYLYIYFFRRPSEWTVCILFLFKDIL